jgi:HAE1 family hydrophobic/amphiphilic exporter-1
MIILLFVLFGVQSYFSLNIENMPETDLPIVTVLTTYPGAAPQDVADNVLKPMEDAVSGLPGIKRLNANAQENFGALIIEFVDGTDGEQAAIDVDREISAIRSTLPDGIDEPRIGKVDLNASPILYLVLSGPQGADALYNLANDSLAPRLQTVNGVGSIDISGGRERQVHVRVNPSQLAAYGLPLMSVGDALKRENVSVTAGNVESADESIAAETVFIQGDFYIAGGNPRVADG